MRSPRTLTGRYTATELFSPPASVWGRCQLKACPGALEWTGIGSVV